ncbi:MAG: Zn-dependent hydrolase [Gemmatimonadaceae bacterium]|nr:Zn-dependent hydrolase [Gemmatimonadaceae bacterium]
MKRSLATSAVLALTLCSACQGDERAIQERHPVAAAPAGTDVRARLARYTTVTLAVDTAGLTANERQMIPLLIDAARAMDPIYWKEAAGDRDSILRSIPDTATRRLAQINYGPWDRLDNDAPFVAEAGTKPPGANLYPRDMTKAELDSAAATSKAYGDSLRSLYTLVRRDSTGRLVAIPYSKAFAAESRLAATKLREAAGLAEDPGLRRYLDARAQALLTDDYRPSDLAWMDMKHNRLDIVIGPIETYEDHLFGYKAAHEAYVLIKDMAWSQRLAKYTKLLPALQRGLPVSAAYKKETPGTASDLNAYNVVYYAGQANAGAKTIAINLPNDEQVQLQKGTRRLQLENVIQAKFDKILQPIAAVLIDSAQLRRINFNAFFENTMFHEVAHGLGIKHTIDGKGTVRAALKERASALEEEKADILGLHMVRALNARGELGDEDVSDNYVTFLASLFRSVRFGASDAHGRANIVSFNFLEQHGAFARDSATGTYHVDLAKMPAALDTLAATILRLQGDGDYAGVGAFYEKYGTISPTLQHDLDRIATKGIPVDVVFEQGGPLGRGTK